MAATDKPTRTDPPGRANQRHRTRKDLLVAAARLLKEGHNPTMDDVAEAAMVSRATAYRYFPTLDALLVEAPLDGTVPTPEELFADEPSADPEERIDKAEAALHDMVYRNEAQLRRMLAYSLDPAARGNGNNPPPVRQNRRTPLIEAALAPARDRLTDDVYATLCAAAALVFGTESMVVLRDVLPLDSERARAVKSWALRALVRSALRDSGAAK
jgi:AcrR family transcriptional regulator